MTSLEKYLIRPLDPVFDDILLEKFFCDFVCRYDPWASRQQWAVTIPVALLQGDSSHEILYYSRRRRTEEHFSRLSYVPHKLGEKWALRRLLLKYPVRNNVNNFKLPGETFLAAAIRLNLVHEGHEGVLAFADARELLATPAELRTMISTLMLDGSHFLSIILNEDGSPNEANVTSLTDDWCQHAVNREVLYPLRKRLEDIVEFLHEKAEKFAEVDGAVHFGLPARISRLNYGSLDLSERVRRILQEEQGRWNARLESEKYNMIRASLNSEQSTLFEFVQEKIDSNVPGVSWVFANGPAGTGKTFVADGLLSYVRSKGFIAKASAATWLAAGNFAGAVSVHNLFGLGVSDGVERIQCAPSSAREILLRECRLLVIDELPFLSRIVFEAVFEFVKTLMSQSDDPNLPLHHMVVLTMGDFRQLAPVVVGNASESSVYEACIASSPRWSTVSQFDFTTLVRQAQDPEYGAFVQSIGNGGVAIPECDIGSSTRKSKFIAVYGEEVEEQFAKVAGDLIEIPHAQFMCDKQSVVDLVYPDLRGPGLSLSERRCILVCTNKQKDEWNSFVQSQLPGNCTRLPAGHVVRRGNLSDAEMQNMSKQSVPSGVLELKVGDVCLVISPVCVEEGGICNNTRVRIEAIHPNLKVIRVKPIGSDSRSYWLPRRWYRNVDMGKHGVIDRLQFPLQLAFAMTVHKAQGQTLEFAAMDCSTPCFAHGQLYVALSRVRKSNSIVFYNSRAEDGAGVVCFNIVYRSLLLRRSGAAPVRRRLPEAGLVNACVSLVAAPQRRVRPRFSAE